MPLVMDGGRIPTLWAGKKRSRPARPAGGDGLRAECVEIALINNMPDAALEDTESQFFELLDAAVGDIAVRVKLYSLPGIPRSDRGQQHLSSFYLGIEDLLNSQFDGVIMTGTEPRQPNLRNEPYWPALVNVLDWAEHNTASTVLSCLAAHAGVLFSEGIERHALQDKQFGLFDYRKVCDHALTRGTADQVRFPHSRWNEVRENALTSCGYVVLTRSAEAGVDLFVKKKKGSLFVHFQGHPEYSARTLLKEYRRDIKRFLRRERETYPTMPHGYFDLAATRLLSDFRENALSRPREELLAAFPESCVADTLQNTWRSSAIFVYRNWLQYIVSKKAETSAFAAVTRAGRAQSRPANSELA
ncbi:MAG TPA: homoserine O-succinyltransferase [Terriglobales bacterium]|nr:homoserine O-succinyltransferase [Terriglobales bacterium]